MLWPLQMLRVEDQMMLVPGISRNVIQHGDATNVAFVLPFVPEMMH
jgi:hypothetical protein